MFRWGKDNECFARGKGGGGIFLSKHRHHVVQLDGVDHVEIMMLFSTASWGGLQVLSIGPVVFVIIEQGEVILPIYIVYHEPDRAFATYFI